MYRWHVDFYNATQLRSTCNYVHVLSLCLFGTKNADDNNSMEKICDSFTTGTYLLYIRIYIRYAILYKVPINVIVIAVSK